MSRNEISADTVGYPMPVTLLGTLYRGRPNFMALSWVTRVDFDPPLIGVAVYRNHASAHGILICVPGLTI